MRTELVIGPAIEPVTLDEAKAQLRVNTTDDDDYITSLIAVAREDCEMYVGRAFLPQTWDFIIDTFPVWGGFANRWVRDQGAHSTVFFPGSVIVPIEIPRPPLISITSVQYINPNSGALVTLDPSLYKVATGTPGRIAPVFGQTWPVPRFEMDAVQIRFVAGYASPSLLSARAKQAIKLLLAHYYENREPVNVGNIVSEIPFGIQRLLAGEEWGSYK